MTALSFSILQPYASVSTCMASAEEVQLAHGRGQKDSWEIEYSCEDYGKDAEGSAGSMGRVVQG